MATVEYFLKIAGIPGESQDRTHKDEIDIETWSWGLTKALTTGPGGATKPVFQEISILKRVDKASPRLAQACVTGEHLQTAVLATRREAGPNFSIDFIVLRLSDIMISSYQSTTGDPVTNPIDTFSIGFAKIEYLYTMQKPDGTLDAPTRWAWDLKANKPF